MIGRPRLQPLPACETEDQSLISSRSLSESLARQWCRLPEHHPSLLDPPKMTLTMGSRGTGGHSLESQIHDDSTQAAPGTASLVELVPIRS